MTREWEDAVRQGSIGETHALSEDGIDINALDRYGQTAPMLATAEGNGNVVAWLVEHGADLDHSAKYGLSTLMLAVIRGQLDVVQLLVAARASTNLRGTGPPGFANKTALDLAIARGHTEMVEILRSAAERRPT